MSKEKKMLPIFVKKNIKVYILPYFGIYYFKKFPLLVARDGTEKKGKYFKEREGKGRRRTLNEN